MEEIKSFMASTARKLAIKANANRINEIMDKIETGAKDGRSSIDLENTPMAVLQFLEENNFKIDFISSTNDFGGNVLHFSHRISW